MDIVIDFDGTVVKHTFPEVGEDIGAAPVLKELVANGHRLILSTMRSNCKNNTGFSECIPEIHNGDFLDHAVEWFKKNEIPLFGIQRNPTQDSWTTSPKAYGQLHIDDAGLGIPLKWDKDEKGNKVGKPYVCWAGAQLLLIKQGILPMLSEEEMNQLEFDHYGFKLFGREARKIGENIK